MTLKQKLEDIKTLLVKLEDGWKEKKIFNDPDVDYLYPYNQGEDLRCELCDGWATVCVLLADLLGLTHFGEVEETKEYTGSSLRDYMSPHLNQQDVWNLMEFADSFLNLMSENTNKIEEQSE